MSAAADDAPGFAASRARSDRAAVVSSSSSGDCDGDGDVSFACCGVQGLGLVV